MKRLIVNADDLGYDPEIDRGILEAHARGIVTRATAMVDTPFAAARCGPRRPRCGVGLHAVLDPAASRAAAEEALRAQLRRFEALRGAPPTHLDSHKHAHAVPAPARGDRRAWPPGRACRSASIDLATRVGAPGRRGGDDRSLPGRRRAAPGLDARRRSSRRSTRVEEGVTELMAHPGYPPSHARTSFGPERGSSWPRSAARPSGSGWPRAGSAW